jgi:hypothetical protein
MTTTEAARLVSDEFGPGFRAASNEAFKTEKPMDFTEILGVINETIVRGSPRTYGGPCNRRISDHVPGEIRVEVPHEEL